MTEFLGLYYDITATKVFKNTPTLPVSKITGVNIQSARTDGYTPDTNIPSSVYGVQMYPNGIPAGTPAAGPIGTPSPLSGTNAYTPNPVSGITASFGYLYGWTLVVQTIDNYFYFDVTYPTTTGSGHFRTPLLGFLIWSTPANSSWVYDYANNSMTRIN
jgi:hypothetical protein